MPNTDDIVKITLQHLIRNAENPIHIFVSPLGEEYGHNTIFPELYETCICTGIEFIVMRKQIRIHTISISGTIDG